MIQAATPLGVSSAEQLRELAAMAVRLADAIENGTPPTRPNGLRRAGPLGWILDWDGEQYALPALVGLGYLATLMSVPGQSMACASLITPDGKDPRERGEDRLDGQARGAYLRRLRAIKDDPDAAEERAWLERELNYRSRTSPAGAERARVAVRLAITKAMDAIRRACPPAAESISARLVTGTNVAYR